MSNSSLTENRPIFKKGDTVVHAQTGIYCRVLSVKKDPNEVYNIKIAGCGNRPTQWFNSKWYVHEDVYLSPLFAALKEEE